MMKNSGKPDYRRKLPHYLPNGAPYFAHFLFSDILITFHISNSAQAQTDSTRLKRIEYVVGASLAFSLFDYVVSNYVDNDIVKKHECLFWHRIIQTSVQTAISYFLYKECGLSSTISFNLI